MKLKQGFEYTTIHDVPYTTSATGGLIFNVRSGKLKVNLLKFKAGHVIPLHRHTDEKVEKIILEGEIEFKNENGVPTLLGVGALYMCGSGRTYYSGTVIKDCVILVVENEDSVIEYPE
jgi:quercetin dioxygenase-like cupin family protein